MWCKNGIRGFAQAMCIALASAGTTAGDELAFVRVGPLNPTFDANYPGSTSDYAQRFHSIGLLRNGPSDDTLGDVLFYTTDRFVFDGAALGMEYTAAATNGRDTWNIETGDERLHGYATGVEFDGRFYFTTHGGGHFYPPSLRVSDGRTTEVIRSSYKGMLVRVGNHLVTVGSSASTLGQIVDEQWRAIDRTYPGDLPLDISSLQVIHQDGDRLYLGPNGVGTIYRFSSMGENLYIEPVESDSPLSTPLHFSALGDRILLTSGSTTGSQLYMIEGPCRTNSPDAAFYREEWMYL